MVLRTEDNPAELLEGLTLEGGWVVDRKVLRPPGVTGGNFSVGYEVLSAQGERAFLKALDFAPAFAFPDPARMLQVMVDAYNFERDMLAACSRHKIRRVLLPIADGTIQVPTAPIYSVNYLILERAEGDLRAQIKKAESLDLAWVLRALHHSAAAEEQLHHYGMAHQDLKPSNVMEVAPGSFKIGDLGRAAYKGHSAPHDSLPFAGDPGYAPPELLYEELSPDWQQRRLGCDAYLLGSLVVFFFLGAGTTALLVGHLDPAHRPGNWGGSYREVLPYVRDAFDLVVSDLEGRTPEQLREDMTQVVGELCEPDPWLRGHPRNRLAARQYGLERYVSHFDLLARRAELGLL